MKGRSRWLQRLVVIGTTLVACQLLSITLPSDEDPSYNSHTSPYVYFTKATGLELLFGLFRSTSILNPSNFQEISKAMGRKTFGRSKN